VVLRPRCAGDQARAEQAAPAIEKEASNLLSRIRSIFGFRRATGT